MTTGLVFVSREASWVSASEEGRQEEGAKDEEKGMKEERCDKTNVWKGEEWRRKRDVRKRVSEWLLNAANTVKGNSHLFIHIVTHIRHSVSAKCTIESFHHQLAFSTDWPLAEDSKIWPSGNEPVFPTFRRLLTHQNHQKHNRHTLLNGAFRFIPMPSQRGHTLFQYFSRVLLQRGEEPPRYPPLCSCCPLSLLQHYPQYTNATDSPSTTPNAESLTPRWAKTGRSKNSITQRAHTGESKDERMRGKSPAVENSRSCPFDQAYL